MDPDKYWRYTLRELGYIDDSYITNVKLTKSLEFAIYDTSMGWKNSSQKNRFLKSKFAMLYDKEDNSAILKGDEANNFLQTVAKKK